MNFELKPKGYKRDSNMRKFQEGKKVSPKVLGSEKDMIREKEEGNTQ